MDKVKSARIDSISRDIALRDPELKKIFQQSLKKIWENDFHTLNRTGALLFPVPIRKS
jgi:hypothetical protein